MVQLPDSTKPLPQPMLNNHQWSLVAITWGLKMLNASVTKICWKVANLNYSHNSQQGPMSTFSNFSRWISLSHTSKVKKNKGHEISKEVYTVLPECSYITVGQHTSWWHSSGGTINQEKINREQQSSVMDVSLVVNHRNRDFINK